MTVWGHWVFSVPFLEKEEKNQIGVGIGVPKLVSAHMNLTEHGTQAPQRNKWTFILTVVRKVPPVTLDPLSPLTDETGHWK